MTRLFRQIGRLLGATVAVLLWTVLIVALLRLLLWMVGAGLNCVVP